MKLPNKSFVYCTNSNRRKILFETEKKAENFMKFNNEEIEKESGYSPQRSYYCIFCSGWHLTSKKVLRHSKSRKERLVEQYTQEHGRKNAENQDISKKLDVLKCEITDISKNKIIFSKNTREEEKERKERNKKIQEEINKKIQDLYTKIIEFTLSEKEIFFSENINNLKMEIKLLKEKEINDDIKMKNIELNILYIVRKKYNIIKKNKNNEENRN